MRRRLMSHLCEYDMFDSFDMIFYFYCYWLHIAVVVNGHKTNAVLQITILLVGAWTKKSMKSHTPAYKQRTKARNGEKRGVREQIE